MSPHDPMIRREAGARRQWLVYVALGIWFVVMGAVAASLLARHVVPLPPPADTVSLSSLRSVDDTGRWIAVHVLYSECVCSRRIIEHLTRSARPTDVVEYVVLVGARTDLTSALRTRGFRVLEVTPDELSTRFGIEAVPLLVVLGPDDTTRYSGGYAERKQGPELRDLHIIARARAGYDDEGLPLFGCAVGRALRQTINPLRLP
jgi:hypothetical protein